jgi:hypothetical protein
LSPSPSRITAIIFFSFLFNERLRSQPLCNIHSESFTIAAGPRQCSHSQVRFLRDSWPHFTVSGSRLPHPKRSRSPYLYSPGTGWPIYTPRHWVPFSSPPRTRRCTVYTVRSPSLCSLGSEQHRKHRFQKFLHCRWSVCESLPTDFRFLSSRSHTTDSVYVCTSQY